MVKVSAYWDGRIEIESSSYSWNKIDGYDRTVRITFNDGTVIRVEKLSEDCKDDIDEWFLNVEHSGKSHWVTTEYFNKNGEPFVDVFEIDAEVVSHEVFDFD